MAFIFAAASTCNEPNRGIRVQRQADLAVTERVNDRSRIDALRQQQRGGGVAEIVKAGGLEPGFILVEKEVRMVTGRIAVT
jgi:hypothetical protein